MLVAAVLEPGVTESSVIVRQQWVCRAQPFLPSSLPLVGHSSRLLTPAGQARHCRALCSTAQGAVPRAEQGGKLKEQAPCKQQEGESLPSPLRCCSQEGFTCLSPSGRRRGVAEPPAAHPRVAGAVTPSLHAQRCARASECNKKERGCSERRKARGTTAPVLQKSPRGTGFGNRIPPLAAPGKRFEDCAKGLQRVLGTLPCPPHIPSPPLCIQHPHPSAVTHRALLHQALVALFPHRDTAPAQEEAFFLFSLPVLWLKEGLLGSS